jgi:hypothetical protein
MSLSPSALRCCLRASAPSFASTKQAKNAAVVSGPSSTTPAVTYFQKATAAFGPRQRLGPPGYGQTTPACRDPEYLGAQLRMLKAQILQFDRLIMAWHRSNEESRRLDDIPGVGPALATALVATVADPRVFRSGRNFSAVFRSGTSRRRSAEMFTIASPQNCAPDRQEIMIDAPKNVRVRSHTAPPCRNDRSRSLINCI